MVNNNDANSLDEQAQIAAKQADDLREQLYLDAFKTVISTRAGRRFVYGLMGKCGWSRTAYAGRNQATNFNSGRQSVANDLVVEMDSVNDEALLLMIKESKEEYYHVRSTINNDNANNGNSSVGSGFDSINTFNNSGNTKQSNT